MRTGLEMNEDKSKHVVNLIFTSKKEHGWCIGWGSFLSVFKGRTICNKLNNSRHLTSSIITEEYSFNRLYIDTLSH